MGIYDLCGDMNLSKIYRPITAKLLPEKDMDNSNLSVPPCDLLAPYISCFWGTAGNITTIASNEVKYGLVIPDTCMDIILDINFTDNSISNTFAGISSKSFMASSKSIAATTCKFAVRFYAWAVILFADNDMTSANNCFTDIDRYFSAFKKELQEQLLYSKTMSERIEITEHYLLNKLNKSLQNHNVMNAIYQMLICKGNVKIKELCHSLALGERQLQRLFKINVGVSPKSLCEMIRFQYLFQDVVLNPGFDIHEAVYKYGFSDQSHLIANFKKYHSMTPSNALKYAFNDL